MATFGVDFAGPYLNLTESETKELETAEDVGSYITGLVTAAAAALKALPRSSYIGAPDCLPETRVETGDGNRPGCRYYAPSALASYLV